MKGIYITVKERLTKAELFFIQKSIELLSVETIDSFRLRLNNPKTILEEIVQVLDAINSKTLRPKYANPLFLEARTLFKNENEITFNTINKEYFISVLKSNSFDEVKYCSTILLKSNNNYCNTLYGAIKAEIKALNELKPAPIAKFEKLSQLIDFFYIELRAQGYSPNYLEKFIRAISFAKLQDFKTLFSIIGTLISRKDEEFTVYIAFKIPNKFKLDLPNKEFIEVAIDELNKKAPSLNSKFEQFLKENSELTFYEIRVLSRDYFQAGFLVKKKLQSNLDIIFMGLSDHKISFENKFYLHGANEPTKGNFQYFEYKLDGYYKSRVSAYATFLRKLESLNGIEFDKLSLSKIQSGLRYLRLGTEVDELENKLLNYWIGMEYIFSSSAVDEDKITRLLKYFKRVHSLSYVKKLSFYIHSLFKTFNVKGPANGLDGNNLNYIFSSKMEYSVSQKEEDLPLIAFRLWKLKNSIKDKKTILEYFENHQNNIEQNLYRVYRLRNEIVHSGSKEKSISIVTSHLRYYLVFIINGFIDYLLTEHIDTDDDGQVSIDDYFKVRYIQFESLKTQNTIEIENLLQLSNPVEYLS